MTSSPAYPTVQQYVRASVLADKRSCTNTCRAACTLIRMLKSHDGVKTCRQIAHECTLHGGLRVPSFSPIQCRAFLLPRCLLGGALTRPHVRAGTWRKCAPLVSDACTSVSRRRRTKRRTYSTPAAPAFVLRPPSAWATGASVCLCLRRAMVGPGRLCVCVFLCFSCFGGIR